MSLHKKTLITVLITMFILGSLLLIYSRTILLNSYRKLEQTYTEEEVQRVSETLDNQIAVMAADTMNYAYWDETYEFVRGESHHYEEHIPASAFALQNIHLMVFLDAKGNVFYTRAADDNHQEVEPPPDILDILTGHPLLNQHESVDEYTAGLLPLPGSRSTDSPENFMMVVSVPISTSDRMAPPVGTLIRVRYLDNAYFQQINDSFSFDVRYFDVTHLPSSIPKAYDELTGSDAQTYYVDVADSDNTMIHGYGLLRDIEGHPALVIQTTDERTHYQEGQQKVLTFGALLVFSALIFGGIPLILLENGVLSRIGQLNQDIGKIGKATFGRIGTERITVSGNDELTALAAGINAMLDRQSLSRKALRESEERLRTVITNTPIILFAVDKDGVYTLSEGRGLSDIGLKPGEVVGQSVYEINKARPEILDNYNRAFKGETIHAVLEISDIYLETWYSPMKNDKGAITGVIGVSTNITERKVTEKALQEAAKAAEAASRAKSTFLANMSHELRTPMNAVIGYTDLLLSGLYGEVSVQQHDRLQRVMENGQHLLSIINDILDLSKIEAGKMDLHLETFQIREMVENLVIAVQSAVDERRNTLTVNIAEDVTPMRADLIKVRQILYNLLNNAAKFTREGQITLTVSRVEPEPDSSEATDSARAKTTDEKREMLQFVVIDTGIGIPPEKINDIFAEFVQVDATSTREYGGTGLGLAITRRFCDLMGGQIQVESEVGKGSTFTVLLPISIEQQTEEDVPKDGVQDSPSPEPVSMEDELRGTVLVIDDDDSVQEVLRHYLAQEGLNVVTAGNGQYGIKLARQIHPAAIILDVLLPKMDGWGVLALLKADPELAEIPVIMNSIVDNRQTGFALGATDYLTKPINPPELKQVIRQHVAVGDGDAINNKPLILLIDDDEPIRRLTGEVLRHENYAILEAANGREALERLIDSVQKQKRKPDLILLDLMMPDMDGFEFLEAIRHEKEWRSIPVIVVTAHAVTKEERERLSVERIIEKSSDTDALLQEVRERVLTYIHRE